MKGIYKFTWDCGRQGYVEGCFVADNADVSKAIGQSVYFGEILGKHSAICGILDEADLILVTTDSQVVSLFEQFELASGYNPLEYLQDEE